MAVSPRHDRINRLPSMCNITIVLILLLPCCFQDEHGHIRGLLMKRFETQSQALQYILRQVPRGYFWWESKDVSADKIDHLAGQWAEHYGTTLPAHARLYKRKKGQATACAVAALLPSGKWRCMLLATDGVGPIRQNTKVQDARTRDGKPRWGHYLMNQATRPREMGGGVHWSWYLDPIEQNQIENYLVTKIKAGASAEVAGFWQDNLLRRPLYAGIRSSLTRILKSNIKLWSAIWKDKPWPGPQAPLPHIAGFK